VLSHDSSCCIVCGRDVSAEGAAWVDHIKPHRTHPHFALEPGNCRTLCAAHDNHDHRSANGEGAVSKTTETGGATGVAFRV
jgi:phage terminase small subunit